MRRAVVFIVVIVALIAAGPAAEAKTYKFGQAGTTSGFKVKVFGIQEPWAPTNQFDHPKPGTHYVAVDMQVKNSEKQQRTFSALIGYHLLDSKHHQYDIAITGCVGLEPGAPQGQMPPKLPIRGFVCFEVPDGATKLKLRVQGSFTAEGALFKLT